MSESIRIDCCSATVDFSKLHHFSRKAGAVWIYSAPTLILILKYENIKFKKKEPQAEGAQHLNYRIKS
jgi:hypothetical protein